MAAEKTTAEYDEEYDEVVILGARGSIPVNGVEHSVYGGATSCVLVKAGSELVLFDAGSGMMKLTSDLWEKTYSKLYSDPKRLHILLSHYHLDHMMGLMMSPVLYDKNIEIVFYAPGGKESVLSALQQMMKRPLWPVGPEVFQAKFQYSDVERSLSHLADSEITVSTMPVVHPGGAYSYRLDWNGKSVVYATDCELDAESGLQLKKFANQADLFIIDAQYKAEEYDSHKGFGHSYIEISASVIAASHAVKGLLFHHAPERTDAELAKLEKKLRCEYPQAGFAKEGDVIRI